MASNQGVTAIEEFGGQVFRAWRPPYKGAIQYSVGADERRSIPIPPNAIAPAVRAKLLAKLGVS